MFTIRKATTADCGLIHDMASIVFPATYKEIISAEQMEFMMDWMYSHDNIRKQMEEDRKSTRLNSSHTDSSRMPSSA